MLQPNPTLSVFRDIVVIAGMLVLCLLGFQEFSIQAQARRDQQVRFQVIGQTITQMDSIYAKQMNGLTDINQIVLRQNQMLLEYQKLLLTTEYLPAAAVKMNPPQQGAKQGTQGAPGQQGAQPGTQSAQPVSPQPVSPQPVSPQPVSPESGAGKK